MLLAPIKQLLIYNDNDKYKLTSASSLLDLEKTLGPTIELLVWFQRSAGNYTVPLKFLQR